MRKHTPSFGCTARKRSKQKKRDLPEVRALSLIRNSGLSIESSPRLHCKPLLSLPVRVHQLTSLNPVQIWTMIAINF